MPIHLKRTHSEERLNLFRAHLQKLKVDCSCEKILVKRKGEIVDCGMINFFQDEDLMNNFPDHWFDYLPRTDAKIAIIGQDWGPYSAMKSLSEKYKVRKNNLFSNENVESIKNEFLRNPFDMTTRNLRTFLYQSAQMEDIPLEDDFMNDLFFTCAVLFARQGKHFRGNHNFAAEVAASKSLLHLKTQLLIIKPDIIITLGGLALSSISNLAGYKYKESFTNLHEKVQKENNGFLNMQIEDYRFNAVPLFHPAAYRSKDEHVKDYQFVWRTFKSLK